MWRNPRELDQFLRTKLRSPVYPFGFCTRLSPLTLSANLTTQRILAMAQESSKMVNLKSRVWILKSGAQQYLLKDVACENDSVPAFRAVLQDRDSLTAAPIQEPVDELETSQIVGGVYPPLLGLGRTAPASNSSKPMLPENFHHLPTKSRLRALKQVCNFSVNLHSVRTTLLVMTDA